MSPSSLPRNRAGCSSAYTSLPSPQGIALADLVGYWFAGPQGWRLMFAFGLLPALLFLFMVLTVPESPRWLYRAEQVG